MEQDYPKMKIVIDRIKQELMLTIPGKPCEIYYNSFGMYINHDEIEKAFKRLEYDKVIRTIETPELFGMETSVSPKDKYIFNILPEFKKYKYKTKLTYSDIANPVYEIKYNDRNGAVTLNDTSLSKPHFDSTNDRVIQYLCKNPNRKITKEEINKECFPDALRMQELKSIIYKLGFKGDIRQAFFRVCKTSLFFTNPVYQKDLDDLGIKKVEVLK